jgi:hypothetical protein
MWSILRGSFKNPSREECNHGFECGRAGGRSGSGETVRLKKEREEIRERVEKMLEQIESIAQAS